MTSRHLLPLGAALAVLAVFVLVSLLLLDRAGVPAAAPALDAGERDAGSGPSDRKPYAVGIPGLAPERDGRWGISVAAPEQEQERLGGPPGTAWRTATSEPSRTRVRDASLA